MSEKDISAKVTRLCVNDKKLNDIAAKLFDTIQLLDMDRAGAAKASIISIIRDDLASHIPTDIEVHIATRNRIDKGCNG